MQYTALTDGESITLTLSQADTAVRGTSSPTLDRMGRATTPVTSAGMGPSVGQYLLLAYLPTEHAVAGAGLQVLYMNECFPVTVAADAAVFDPENTRMNA